MGKSKSITDLPVGTFLVNCWDDGEQVAIIEPDCVRALWDEDQQYTVAELLAGAWEWDDTTPQWTYAVQPGEPLFDELTAFHTAMIMTGEHHVDLIRDVIDKARAIEALQGAMYD